jgi:hypothetical protein
MLKLPQNPESETLSEKILAQYFKGLRFQDKHALYSLIYVKTLMFPQILSFLKPICFLKHLSKSLQ